MSQKPDGLTIVVVNWIRKQKKCYLAVLPSRLWDNFRSIVSFSEGDIKNANAIVKSATGDDFADIRKIYYSVMQGTMDRNEIQVLTGRANMETATHCMTHLDLLIVKYYNAWEKVGIILPVL